MARPGNSIFDQPWWLDAAAPGAWDEVTVERDGQVVGRLPFVTRRRLGLTSLVQPPLTASLGPWISDHSAKEPGRLEHQKKVLAALIDALPSFDVFDQNVSPSVRNWLPFHWAGFDVTPRVTYRLDDLSDLDAVFSGFEADVRAQIRKAGAALEVRADASPDAFLGLNRSTLETKGVVAGYDDGLVRRIDAACVEHGVRAILLAEDAAGRVHAGVYIVWDDRTAYYLMGGRAAEHERGATSLLLWHAIRHAAGVTAAFDFEGSMVESLERYFRAFGASQVPYVHVRKESRRASAIRRALRR